MLTSYKTMNIEKIIRCLIGWIEVLIGIITVLGCTVVQTWRVYSTPSKPLNVYVFVVITAVAAIILGVGLIAGKTWARILLIVFSGYVIITKGLIYTGLMAFSGAMITLVPRWGIDIASVLYHMLVMIFLLLTKEKTA